MIQDFFLISSWIRYEKYVLKLGHACYAQSRISYFMPHALFLPMLVYKSKDEPGSSRKGIEAWN